MSEVGNAAVVLLLFVVVAVAAIVIGAGAEERENLDLGWVRLSSVDREVLSNTR